MANRAPPPVSSFGEKLLAALYQGAKEPFLVKLKTRTEATKLMHRLNSLRMALRREKHPDWEALYKAGIYRHATNPEWIWVKPKDSEFDEAFRGLKDTTPPLPASLQPAPDDDESTSVSSFLSNLKG